MATSHSPRLTDESALRLAAADPLGERRAAHLSRAHQVRAAARGRRSRRCPNSPAAAARERPIRVASVEEIERELAVARKLGVRFVALGEPDYPPVLRQIDSAPPVLAFRGRRGGAAAAGGGDRRIAQRLRRRPHLRRPARARTRAAPAMSSSRGSRAASTSAPMPRASRPARSACSPADTRSPIRAKRRR